MTNIAPGWYKDPADPTTQRYWDGEGWLGDPLPVDATPPPGPPPAKPSSPAGSAGHPSGQTLGAPAGSGGVGGPGQVTEPGRGAGSGPAPGSAPGQVGGAPTGWPPTGPGQPPPGLPPGLPPSYYLRQLPPPRPHGLPLATPGARFLARLVDITAVVLLNVVVNGWFAYQWWRTVEPAVRTWWSTGAADSAALPQRATWLLWTIMFVGVALWFAYEVPAVAGTGQTLGKRMVGITVMRLESPEPVGFRRSMRRWNRMGLPTLLWPCFGVGLLLQFVDSLFVAIDRPLHQAIHDKAALTVVVNTRSRHRARGDDGRAKSLARRGAGHDARDGEEQ